MPGEEHASTPREQVGRVAFWLSLLMIFTVPWENLLNVGGLGTACRLVGLLTAACWVLKIVFTSRLRKPLLFHGVVLLFVLWNALSLFWTVDVDATSESVLTYLQTFVFVLILWDLYTTESRLRAAFQSYVLGAYVSIASLLSNYQSQIHFNSRRFTAGDFHPNSLAFILALGIPVAVQLAVDAGAWPLKAINLAYVPLATFGILLTGSRAGFVAALVGIAYMLFAFTRAYPRGWRMLVAGALGLVVLSVAYAPHASLERIEGTGAAIEEGGFNGRLRIWLEGAGVFYRHPVLGVGSGAFASGVEAISSGVERWRPPHNLALSLLAEVGIVGFMLYAAVLAMAAAHAARRTAWHPNLWRTMIVVWFLAAAVHNFENKKQTWLFLSLAVASSRLLDRSAPRPSEAPA
jgi:O-antigen ligase